MDNDASNSLKEYIITNQDSQYQLLEPHNHWVNAAQILIQNFKDHFVAGLCGTEKDFPVILVNALLEQAMDTH